MVAKAKKKKKSANHRPARTPFEIVKVTNYLNLAIMVRTLATVYDWSREQLDEFMESYLALMQETADHRVSIKQSIQDTKDITGIDVAELLDKSCEEVSTLG